MSRPRVVILADAENWAWARKARHLQRHLSNGFDVSIWYTRTQGQPPRNLDLYHTFEFPQVDAITWNARILTGITAHVWQAWPDIGRWARRCQALHANSLLLKHEIRKFHKRVYYTPNGVCPEQFRRTRPRDDSKLVVGHVGKPNPRKGAHLIRQACKMAGVELRLIQNTSKNAINAEAMLDWYQDIHVMVFASDMDGTPNPALEGAACESAVISTRIGNMPEFIRDGHNGFLVDRTPHAIAARLIELKHDVPRAVALGKEARATVLADWTWGQQAEHYRRMWTEVL